MTSRDKYLQELVKQAILEALFQKQDLFSSLVKGALEDMVTLNEPLVKEPFKVPEKPFSQEEVEFQSVVEEDSHISDEPENSVPKLVLSVLEEGLSQGADSIHFQPSPSECQVRYKIQGTFKKGTLIDSALARSVVVRIKLLANMDLSTREIPQDGEFDFCYKKKYCFKGFYYAHSLGERVVIKVLSSSQGGLIDLENLGLDESQLKILLELIQKKGLFLVAGPTGSGKTTLLYSLLSQMDSSSKNIITIESPVEYHLSGVSQLEVNLPKGLTFSCGITTARRQEADVLMSKIEDLETANLLFKTALEGTVVLASLHTMEGIQTITRLLDLGIPPYSLASCLKGVISSRLIRRICSHCKEECKPTATDQKLLSIDEKTSLFRGAGCPLCGFKGYLGEEAVFEILQIDREMESAILENPSLSNLSMVARKQLQGKTLKEMAKNKVKKGITTVEEILKIFDF